MACANGDAEAYLDKVTHSLLNHKYHHQKGETMLKRRRTVCVFFVFYLSGCHPMVWKKQGVTPFDA